MAESRSALQQTLSITSRASPGALPALCRRSPALAEWELHLAAKPGSLRNNTYGNSWLLGLQSIGATATTCSTLWILCATCASRVSAPGSQPAQIPLPLSRTWGVNPWRRAILGKATLP